MTDVRAILEQESKRLKWRTFGTVVFALIWGAFLLYIGFAKLQHGLTVGNLIGAAAPLVGLSSIAVSYSTRHQKALEAAIEDPDPALDRHFAAVLEADEPDVAALGRSAFLRRFEPRLPQLDDQGWRQIAGGLSNAPVEEAERLLNIIVAGGTATVVAPLESFARGTSNERLRTAAHTALGEIRLRLARTLVEGASESALNDFEGERNRLNLRS